MCVQNVTPALMQSQAVSYFQVNIKQFFILLLCDGCTVFSEGLYYTAHQIPSKFYSSLHLRVTIKFSHTFSICPCLKMSKMLSCLVICYFW